MAIKGLGIRRILGRLKKKLISMRPRKLPVSPRALIICIVFLFAYAEILRNDSISIGTF